jgi:hypothetical protein
MNINPNYDAKKTQDKAKHGGIEGALISIISLALFGLIKGRLNLGGQEDNIIAGISALLAGIILQSGQKAYFNWKKHH